MPTTRTALITGATRGIGQELTKQASLKGIRVFATGRDADLLANLQAETGCLGKVCDLTDPEAVVRLYATARQALGKIDILVNNAGGNSRKSPLVESTLEEFDAHYALNLRAPYILCREAMKEMAPRQSGQIINVISSCALFSNENMGAYTTMKAGLRGLTGVLIKEARRNHIKVTAVYPGGVNTEFRTQARPDYMSPASVATMIMNVILAPADVVMHDLTFRPWVEDNF